MMQNHPNSACHFAVFKSARPKVQEVDRDDLFCLDMIEKPLQIRQQSFSESNQMSPLMAITLGFGPEKESTRKESQTNILELCNSQKGAYQLQNSIKNGSAIEKNKIFCSLRDSLVEISRKQFGNFVVQYLLEHCDECQRNQIINRLEHRANQLVFHKYSSRVIEKALNISTDAQFDRIYTNLSPKLSEYVFDQNASHVLQIVIERKGDAVKPMSFETSAETLHRAATDRVGSRAVQKAVDAFGAERSKALGAALVVHAKDLAVCSFGNYVLQTLLLRKFDDLNLKICVALCESFTTFACHKFGSNVMETCLRVFGSRLKKKFYYCVLGNKHVVEIMANHKYGNFVLQEIVRNCDDNKKWYQLTDVIDRVLLLKESRYQKHIKESYRK